MNVTLRPCLRRPLFAVCAFALAVALASPLSAAGKATSDDGAAAELWRNEYLYSRAATIYGGTAEVQRNIIARRLLELGDEA